MSGIDRKENLRVRCPDCRGNGFVQNKEGESFCEKCQGLGLLEQSVPYQFDGERSKEDVEAIMEGHQNNLPDEDPGCITRNNGQLG